MKPLVAITGKGGTGKSTLAALLVQALAASGVRPVLAVDADPNACLGELLGVEVPGTLAELREEARKKGDRNPGVSLVSQIDLGLNEIVSEGEGFDLLTMGLPEGPGCYCYINALLRDWLKKAARNYAICVVDNQAGMEHVSRLVTAAVDTLVVVAEPTAPAAKAVRRIMELSRSLPMTVARRIVVWNKVRGEGVAAGLREIADEESADGAICLAWDERLAAAYTQGRKVTLEGEGSVEFEELVKICRPSGGPGAGIGQGEDHADTRHA